MRTSMLVALALAGCGSAECPAGFVEGEGNLCLQQPADTDTDTDADADTDADTDTDTDADTDTDTETTPVDSDLDGSFTPDDCDDANDAVFPGAAEICDNGIDDDCDALTVCRWAGPVNVPDSTLSGTVPYELAFTDVTGDGAADLLVATFPQPGAPIVGVIEGVASGTYAAAYSYRIGSAIDATPFEGMASGDLTGDGQIDVALNGGPGAFVVPGPVAADLTVEVDGFLLPGFEDGDTALSGLAVGDADGDQQDDLLVGATAYGSNNQQGSAYLILGPVTSARPLQNSDTIFQGETSSDHVGEAVSLAADLDADGVVDPVISGLYALWAFNGATLLPGLYVAPVDYDHRITYGVSAVYHSDQLGAADIDGDGYSDLALAIYDNNEGRAVLAHGPLAADMPVNSAAVVITDPSVNGAFGKAIDATHDLDGDGNLDLVVVETGDSYQVNVYYGPLSGSYPSSAADARLLLQTEEYVDLVVGDLDRDGFHDIGVGYETRDAMEIFIGGSL